LSESSIEPTTTGIQTASATALAAILGEGLIPAKEALMELTKRNKALLDGGDDAIVDALGRQAVVLEALFYRLLQNAGNAKQNEVVTLALKSAMNTQKSLLSTLGAIRQMRGPDA
jgi:hypothetical protein